ncbi:MAG: sulfite exporter TauE/SafE family protein [Acidihalobacter sp.]
MDAMPLLLFGVGALAGVVNVLAAGGSMLTVPLLIFAGLDPTVANGTNRVAIVLQNLTAVGRFRHVGLTDTALSTKLALWTLPGGILGAWYGASIDDAALRLVLAGVLLVTTLTLFLPQRLRTAGGWERGRWLVYPAMLGIGFYGGFIQIGVGFLLLAALRGLLGVDLVRANAHKVFVVLVYMLPALLVFWWLGKIDWRLGLAVGSGNIVGAWVATHLALKGGERWIRVVVAVAAVAMAGKLLAGSL